MNLLDSSLLILMLIGLILLVLFRSIERRLGENAADGVIVGTAFLELWVLGVGLIVKGSFDPVTIGAAAILAWMIGAYITFLILVRRDTFPYEDFPPPHCVPKKTFGKEIDYRDSQSTLFANLHVRFRCRPGDSNLHKSLRARTWRFWGLVWVRETVICRHDTEILCDAACNAGANHTGVLGKGSEALRVQLLLTQINVGRYIEIEVKMFAARGAARVVITGGATLGANAGQTAGGTTTVAPGTSTSSSSTTGASGSVNAGVVVTFPDASLVIEYDAGFFQWQCVPPDGAAVLRLDLDKLASNTIAQNGIEPELLTLLHCDWKTIDEGDGLGHTWYITFISVISIHPPPIDAELEIQYDSGMTSIRQGDRKRITSITCRIHLRSREGDLGNVKIERVR